ncbi:hypothetical protein LEP1GSC075_1276 [Leptospira interrogans str. Kito]|nr:hypothetical protein LEP1GSC069_1501 [Leptospira interrogans serovar Canicola str. Fiocruz LV133]EMK23208.1 hypothetical protein LEP1GSC075_1276 [Leptospira interrogans str. Kito]EMN77872.1 hypothetical protein LEP1GSC102_1376 [Leptospira interrogans str. UI 09600]
MFIAAKMKLLKENRKNLYFGSPYPYAELLMSLNIFCWWGFSHQLTD